MFSTQWSCAPQTSKISPFGQTQGIGGERLDAHIEVRATALAFASAGEVIVRRARIGRRASPSAALERHVARGGSAVHHHQVVHASIVGISATGGLDEARPQARAELESGNSTATIRTQVAQYTERQRVSLLVVAREEHPQPIQLCHLIVATWAEACGGNRREVCLVDNRPQPAICNRRQRTIGLYGRAWRHGAVHETGNDDVADIVHV